MRIISNGSQSQTCYDYTRGTGIPVRVSIKWDQNDVQRALVARMCMLEQYRKRRTQLQKHRFVTPQNDDLFHLLFVVCKSLDTHDDRRQWASCQIRKIACCACVGITGNVFLVTDFKRNASWRSWHTSRHVRHTRAVMHVGTANPRRRWKLPRHSRRMYNPQFTYRSRRVWWDLLQIYHTCQRRFHRCDVVINPNMFSMAMLFRQFAKT